jgi:hypothetical protein
VRGVAIDGLGMVLPTVPGPRVSCWLKGKSGIGMVTALQRGVIGAVGPKNPERNHTE